LILNADGLDSIADDLVSFIVCFCISMLQKPKSKQFHFGYAEIERLVAFVAAIVIIGIFIASQAYQKIIYRGVGIINPQLSMITLIEAGTISLPGAFRVRGIAKEYDLISLNLCAKKPIKDGTGYFVVF
jgi:divalent metal cation (Fe/Co/Zn/Cd) transporter